ncbi:MAG: hypothetical protein Q9175_004934 [Cornicularia normoerica]
MSRQAVSGEVPRSRGGMMYIRDVEPHGIIVHIRDKQQNVTNTTGLTNPVVENLVSESLTLKGLGIRADRCGQLPMDNIDIFDVTSYYNPSIPDGTWYKFTTTYTSEVFLRWPRSRRVLRRKWVLSIPSLTWTKVYQGESPRFGHMCHRVGDRTMIAVGGAENDNWHRPPCVWETKGVGVFSLSDLIWGSVYDASAPAYAVPAPIASRIGGFPSGSAARYEPTVCGFDQAKVHYQRPSAGSAPTPSLRPSGSRPSHWTAIIVGCLVDGIACITLVIGLGLKRHNRHRIISGESSRQEINSQESSFQVMDNQENDIQEMDVPERVVQDMYTQGTFSRRILGGKFSRISMEL